jgi:hypothetical protein
MGELQEAAATTPGRIRTDRSSPAGDTGLEAAAETPEPTSSVTAEPTGREAPAARTGEGASAAGARAPGSEAGVAASRSESPPRSAPDTGVEPAAQRNGDLDGARLTALNMALSGAPREETDRYLAENFELPDREQLIADVYAAIEG